MANAREDFVLPIVPSWVDGTSFFPVGAGLASTNGGGF